MGRRSRQPWHAKGDRGGAGRTSRAADRPRSPSLLGVPYDEVTCGSLLPNRMKRTKKPVNALASPTARRGRAGSAGDDALSHAAAALQRAGFLDATLVLRWREIAGEDIARIAEPVRLTDGPEGGVLTLKCDPGAAVFLQHQTRDLIERLARYLGPGRIARVRLISGEFERPNGVPDHPAIGTGRPVDGPSAPSLSEALERLNQRRKRPRAKTR